MQNKKIFIVDAESKDVNALATLMNELGYKTTEDEMKQRFDDIKLHKDYKTLIAIIDSEVAGMIGMAKNYSYENNGLFVRIVALVTSTKFRQIRVGKKLMESAEEWARNIEAATILLNCGNREERATAHLFYKKIGYVVKSTGFIKKL